MLDEVLFILGISNAAQTDLVTILFNQSSAKILAYINESEVPANLAFILNELTISRYNRLGSEGITSESVEGIQYSYMDNELLPYYTYLDRYIENKTGASGFRFL